MTNWRDIASAPKDGTRIDRCKMMEDNMVERIARLIYDEYEGPVNNQDFGRQVKQWDRSKIIAYAIIAAMREPTNAMIDAGFGTEGRRFGRDRWQAMIDAALS